MILYINEKVIDSLDLIRSQLETIEEQLSKFNEDLNPSLEKLEELLIETIYDFIIKAPTIWKKDHRGITPQRKEKVKKRDKCICQICGAIAKGKKDKKLLRVDHIYPHSLGGSNFENNLMILCEKCNSDKNASLDYYKSKEGKIKLKLNIQEFARSLPIMVDFEKWLKNMGDGRRRISKSNQKQK